MTDSTSGRPEIVWDDLVPRITTERLVLRLATEADVDALLDFYERNFEHFEHWMPTPSLSHTTESLRQMVKDREDLARADRGYRFHLFPRDEPDKVIGLLSIADVRRGAIEQCVLGYAIDCEYQGKGLTKEAVAAAIRFAFEELNLHRIEGSYMPENTASAAILASFGFEQQGYFKEYLLLDGEWRDHIVTFLVNPNWKGIGRLVDLPR